jgi:hypothetical protein
MIEQTYPLLLTWTVDDFRSSWVAIHAPYVADVAARMGSARNIAYTLALDPPQRTLFSDSFFGHTPSRQNGAHTRLCSGQ